MAQLRVAMIGGGTIAELHAKGHLEDPRSTIVAVCDTNEDLAIKRALDWGAQHFYTTFEECLADPNVDAVDIITPNHLHAAQIIAALRAGKHVLVERPMATSLEHADMVVRAARETDRILQIYEPCLFYKPFLDARNLIDAGEIGTATHLDIRAMIGTSTENTWNFAQSGESWRFDPQKAGGSPSAFEVVYQAFCISLFLIGSVERIHAWREQTPLASGVALDCPTTAMWKHFQQACFGSLSYTYAPERLFRTNRPPLEFGVRVTGTRGDIFVTRSPDPGRSDAPVELHRNSRKVEYSQKKDSYDQSFVRATKNFISACRGEEEPLLQAEESKQLLVLTLASEEAARSSRTVKLRQG
jgi:predicted dehydrogenase